jgi:ornithine cyclodeaminase/alanine dehydrogenase-like protein (mu-crystallin family)
MGGLRAFMDFLERFYLEWADQNWTVIQPPKHFFQRSGIRGDWRVMPCAVTSVTPANEAEWHGIDAVKIIGSNEEERVVTDKISVGKALLLHPTDHFVEAMFDVAALSSFRTAAIAVLAYKYCGHRPDHTAGLVGAGRVGFYTAVILNEWLGIRHLLVHDINESRGRDFLTAVNDWYGARARCAGLATLRAESQSLFLATTSPHPLIDGRHERHAPLIASVGADADNLSELDAHVLEGRMLVSESKDNVACGDLRRWHDAGIIRTADIVMLSTLMSDARRSPPTVTPAVFISTGTAIQDALVCRFLHDRLGGRGGVSLAAHGPDPA